MNINIKPTLIIAREDYHQFYPYQDKDFMQLGFPMNYFEFDTSKNGFDNYKAVTWAEGSENELFEFIFTNEKVWNALVYAAE